MHLSNLDPIPQSPKQKQKPTNHKIIRTLGALRENHQKRLDEVLDEATLASGGVRFPGLRTAVKPFHFP